MLVKINRWVSTGNTIHTGNFGWCEMKQEKVVLDTDLVEVFNPSFVKRDYGFPYDIVNIPYKKLHEYPFQTDGESYKKLIDAMNVKVVDL